MPVAPPASPPPHAVACLKDAGGEQVWLLRPPGAGPRTLKVWPATPAMRLKLVAGAAQPQRQARGARRLAAAGVPTPDVCGRWRHVRRNGRRAIELQLAYVEGISGLEALERAVASAPVPVERLRALGRALGEIVGAIATAGLVHRDLKLRNVIVAEGDADPAPRVWVIDPVGVRRTTRRVRAILVMLDRLLCEPATEGIPVPPVAWSATVRAAVKGQPDAVRGAVRGQLRGHLRAECAAWGVPWEDPPPPGR